MILNLSYMADDQDTNQTAEEVVEVVEKEVEKIEVAAEKAVEAADEAKEALVEAKEAVAEIVEEPKKTTKAVSKDLGDIISKIEKLSVLELADLVHALEDKFGVSASAPVAVAPSASSGQAPSGEAAAEEQTTFNVILSSGGANKIAAIKAVRELVPTLGLKEAKDLVEAAPKPVMEGVNKVTANEAKTKLTAAGATVELQ